MNLFSKKKIYFYFWKWDKNGLLAVVNRRVHVVVICGERGGCVWLMGGWWRYRVGRWMDGWMDG